MQLDRPYPKIAISVEYAPSQRADESPDPAADLSYQDAILQDVSRTFALTIPQLPGALHTVVGNAYLLCRIADTIEDSEVLPTEEKERFYKEFLAIVGDGADAEAFSQQLPPKLTGSTLEAERDLICNTPTVMRITRSFSEADQQSLHRCVRIMSDGMEQFQEGHFQHGLRDLPHLDDYCYHVAGVVGEMLCELFCAHSPATAVNRAELEKRAVSFGQGLQMTNILKDIWDDKTRDVCWLPRETFERHGFDLTELQPGMQNDAFEAGLRELIGVAHAHLRNALDYTLLIPKSEPGIRRFCLWALGMAVLTLRKLNRTPGFTTGTEVKITRRSVKTVVFATSTAVRSDAALRLLFKVVTSGLPLEKGALIR